MTWEVILVLSVLVLMIIFLFLEVLRPAYTLFLGMAIFLMSGIISPEQALDGVSNKQLSIIVLLLIVGNIFKKSSIIDSTFRLLFRKNDSPRTFLLKMCASVGPLSAFFNNTPLVAMMMPYIYRWSKGNNQAVSKFLIPLSFASILGGCVTLIGTSTLLIVDGLATSMGEAPLSIFSFTPVGLPLLVIGSIYLIFFSNKLLPNTNESMEDILEASRRYFFETFIEKDSSLIGNSIEDAGLRNLKGLFLVEIMRGERSIRPVSSKEILKEGDVLFFAGETHAIEELTNTDIGLSLPQEARLDQLDQKALVEVVLSHNSKLAGQQVKDTDFRARYDGAVLAIHRNGERLWGQLGNITLRTGDVLLVMAGNDFESRTKNNPAFYVISQKQRKKETSISRVLLLLIGILGAVGLASFGIVDLFLSLTAVVTLAIILKVVNQKEIINSIDFSLILVIVSGLAIGQAMVSSGTADIVSKAILSVTQSFGPIGILTILFISTNILSSLVTTQAAVAVTLPISLQLGHALGLPIEPFIMIIGFAGAANFMTPIGYQTNLMVYGPGGYKFRDFFKVGLPLTLLYLAGSVAILTNYYNL